MCGVRVEPGLLDGLEERRVAHAEGEALAGAHGWAQHAAGKGLVRRQRCWLKGWWEGCRCVRRASCRV